MRTSTALALLLLVALAPLVAQEPVEANKPQGETFVGFPPTPTIDEKDLVIQYVKLQGDDPDRTFKAIQNVHGTSHVVRDGGGVRKTRNLQIIGNLMMICDSAARAAQITAATQELDKVLQQSNSSPAASYITWEYTPRYLSLNDVQNAVQTFRRSMVVLGPEGNRQQVDNMNMLNARGLMVVRDVEKNIADMKAVLDRVDVPRPQITMTCMLLRTKPDLVAKGLPAELVENLKKLTGNDGFEMVTSGVIRTAANGGGGVELTMTGATGVDAKIQLSPAGYDPKAGVLTLSSIALEFSEPITRPDGQVVSSRQRFSTSTTVPTGEYTVLGAFGLNPVYVVLRIAATD